MVQTRECGHVERNLVCVAVLFCIAVDQGHLATFADHDDCTLIQLHDLVYGTLAGVQGLLGFHILD